MLQRFAVLALELAAGVGLWLLVRRNAVMGPTPAWVRLYIGIFFAVFLGAAGTAFFSQTALFGLLSECLIAGYVFAEILAADIPEYRVRWRKLKRTLLDGRQGHFPEYYE